MTLKNEGTLPFLALETEERRYPNIHDESELEKIYSIQ